MRIQVKSFASLTLWDSSYEATLLNPGVLPGARPVFIEESLSDSDYSGMFTRDVRSLALQIRIKNYGQRETLRAQLMATFKPGTRDDLVATFAVDGMDYFLPAVVQTAPVASDGSWRFTVILQSESTAWRAQLPDTDTWNLTGAGGTKSITVEGDDETRLSVTLTPSAPPLAGAYLHQNLYQLVPASGLTVGLRPWCITLDTAALISDNANKCQVNNGAGVLAGVTTIPYDTVTGTVPSKGRGYCGTEQFSWTGKTGTTSGNLTGVTRGINGTTAAAHADNAVIYMSKLAADCSDLRVWDGDAETRRWIVSPNTSATKVWCNVDVKTGARLTLAAAVAGTGAVTALQFAVNATSKARLAAMPPQGIVYHGSEWFFYSSRDAINCRLAIGQRGLYNTAQQAHSIGDSFDFIPVGIRLVYDNGSATDPSLADANYDDTKPLFSLSSSDNTKWVWSASDLFYDPDHPNRPGGWIQLLQILGNLSQLYRFTQDAESGSPALGMELASWKSGSLWKPEKGRAAWVFKDPLGMQKITVTGSKYRNTAKWPNDDTDVAGIQRTSDGVKWITVFTEAKPASAAVWTNLTNNSVAKTITNTTKQVRAILSHVLDAQANAVAYLEILTGTIEFTTANIPAGSLLGEQLNYPLDLTLKNNTTGDSIALLYPMRMSQDLVLDGEANELTYHGASAHNALGLNDEGRSIWVRLAKGANELQVSGVDVGTLAAALSWYRRRL